MSTSKKWIEYFSINSTRKRIDWSIKPAITAQQIKAVLHSLQAWQLGETSDGENLLRAATKYARKINDPDYVESVALFIKEEQKHGDNLGRYLDLIGQKRIRSNWGDTLFRKFRHLNTSMESWTLAVLVVENTAQIFYQSLKDATDCELLQQICTDILTDEAPHIRFQTQRLAIIFENKTPQGQLFSQNFYKLFFFATTLLIWMAHKKLFRAGGNTFRSYIRKMKYKYRKTMPAHTGNHLAGSNWSFDQKTREDAADPRSASLRAKLFRS